MKRSTRVLRSTALIAATTTALLSLAACGPGDSDKGRKGKGGSSDSSASGKSKPKPKAKTGSGMLQLGETAPESVEMSSSSGKADFEVTMEKVVMGKPGDLDELDDAKKYAGKVPAWLYASYEHVGGASPMELSTISDLGLTVEGGERARPLLLLMGELSAKPADCRDSGDVGELASGQRDTICQVFLVPEGKQVETALLSRGFTTAPFEWEVD